MKLYVIYYPDEDTYHAMYKDDVREGIPGVLCCRERDNIETWLLALTHEGYAEDAEIRCLEQEDLIAEINRIRTQSYSLWIMDTINTEVIYF